MFPIHTPRLKASWGQQGNDAIGDYRYTDTYYQSATSMASKFPWHNTWVIRTLPGRPTATSMQVSEFELPQEPYHG